MTSQEEYNEEYDKSVDDNHKKGIKLIKRFVSESSVEAPNTELEIDFSKGAKKVKKKPVPIVKVFKPIKKEDEPIW